jgi:hypothetical protein
MKLSDPRIRRALYVVLGALSALAIVYVIVLHSIAASRRATPDARETRETFSQSDALPKGYSVASTRGTLAWSVKGGVLAIEGSGHAEDAIEIAAETRRFDDGVIALHFRAMDTQPVEVFIGVETDSAPKRRVVTAYVAGPEPMVRVGGDISHPLREMRRDDAKRIDADAGAEAGADAGAAASGGQWHALELQLTPMFAQLGAFLDGQPMGSVPLGWSQGERAHVFFGVRARGDVTRTRVEIDSLSYKTLDWTLSSFEDTFSGEYLDPGRWGLSFPDPDLAHLDIGMTRGNGVFLGARANAMLTDDVHLFTLRTIPFPMHSFTLRAEMTVDELQDANLFFGVMGANSWTSMDRSFDVGVAQYDAGKPTVYAGGAWWANGAIGIDHGPELTLPARVDMTLRYDAATLTGTASVFGKELGKHQLDLKPLEIIAVRLGSHAHKVGGHVKVTVHRVVLEQR